MKTIDCNLLDQIAVGRGNNGGGRTDNGDRGRGAFGGDANPNSVNGQCHW